MDRGKALTDLYNQIKDLTSKAGEVYDRMQYVITHGCLPPEEQKPQLSEMDIYQLKDKKRKLNDLICKTQKKLQPSAKPPKADKLIEWQMKLDMAIAERSEVDKILHGA